MEVPPEKSDAYPGSLQADTNLREASAVPGRTNNPVLSSTGSGILPEANISAVLRPSQTSCGASDVFDHRNIPALNRKISNKLSDETIAAVPGPSQTPCGALDVFDHRNIPALNRQISSKFADETIVAVPGPSQTPRGALDVFGHGNIPTLNWLISSMFPGETIATIPEPSRTLCEASNVLGHSNLADLNLRASDILHVATSAAGPGPSQTQFQMMPVRSQQQKCEGEEELFEPQNETSGTWAGEAGSGSLDGGLLVPAKNEEYIFFGAPQLQLEIKSMNPEEMSDLITGMPPCTSWDMCAQMGCCPGCSYDDDADVDMVLDDSSVLEEKIVAAIIPSQEAANGPPENSPLAANAAADPPAVVENPYKMSAPAKEFREKFCNVMKTLKKENIVSQCDEIRQSVRKENLMWMALHFVTQRVSKKPNHHFAYAEFMVELEIPNFVVLVLKETLRIIKRLLQSDVREKKLAVALVNMGQWLGLMIMANRKPLPQDIIDFKVLIADANARGDDALLFVLPFVLKVMETCTIREELKPPHPWTISILSVLAELYKQRRRAMMLRPLIKPLLDKLKIRVKDLQPSDFLKKWKKQ